MTAQDDPWKFARRAGACAACGSSLPAGTEAVSAIYSGDEGFARRDFCGACFQDAAKRGSPFSWWSAVVPEPEKKKAVFDLGVAKEFFQRLLRDDDPSRASLRYLLALMLMRKRVVVLVGQERSERGEVMTIRIPPDDEPVHEIACVELDEAETERVREELGRLFHL